MSTKKKQSADDGLHKISREEVEEMRQKPAVRLVKIGITVVMIIVIIYASGAFR